MTVRERTFDLPTAALSAIENASRMPAARLAASFGSDNQTLASSYARTRREVAAANPELGEFGAQLDLLILATWWGTTAAYDVESDFRGPDRIVRPVRIGYEPNSDALAKQG
jgi:hypothetical protein